MGHLTHLLIVRISKWQPQQHTKHAPNPTHVSGRSRRP